MRAYCDEWDFRYTWTERQKLRKTQTGIQRAMPYDQQRKNKVHYDQK